MKKGLLALLSLVVSASVAAGSQPQTLSLILDWFPNPNHAPIIIAEQQGYFKEQGLEVNIIGPADPTDPPKLVAAGKADIGITYEPELMQQIDRGLPLIRIGTLIDKPLTALVALKGQGITTVSDLKGKRIGSSNSGLSSTMLKVLLRKEGISSGDVELINVRYNLAQALLTHKVDAVTGVMRNYEIPQLEGRNQHVVTFFPEEHGIPNYSELVFVINSMKMKDDRYPRFLAAIKKGVRYLDEHPKEAWLGFAKQYPESNNTVNREAWFATIPYFAEEPSQFNKEEWHSFAEFMLQNKLIKKIQPDGKYAVDFTLETL